MTESRLEVFDKTARDGLRYALPGGTRFRQLLPAARRDRAAFRIHLHEHSANLEELGLPPAVSRSSPTLPRGLAARHRPDRFRQVDRRWPPSSTS